MLNTMKDCCMCSEPVFSPKGAMTLGTGASLDACGHGVKKARRCCDGSRLTGKGLKNVLVASHSACIGQIGVKTFCAKSHVVIGADVINACAQSPPQDKPTFAHVCFIRIIEAGEDVGACHDK